MREVVSFVDDDQKAHLTNKLTQHVTFSKRYSSGEDDEDDMARRKSNKIIVSPLSRPIYHHLV
jgi:hypothetical protein